ncbi:MAG: hypothetical protein KDK34_19490 [Leptospiraceae bacterium]|nr:hypothetical protein [Leptospiraceae bacterium]
MTAPGGLYNRDAFVFTENGVHTHADDSGNQELIADWAVNCAHQVGNILTMIGPPSEEVSSLLLEMFQQELKAPQLRGTPELEYLLYVNDSLAPADTIESPPTQELMRGILDQLNTLVNNSGPALRSVLERVSKLIRAYDLILDMQLGYAKGTRLRNSLLTLMHSHRVNLRTTDVSEFIRETGGGLKSFGRMPGLNVRFFLRSRGAVLLDGPLFSQVVYNIFKNALDEFKRLPGKVHVIYFLTFDANDGVHIRIGNNGPHLIGNPFAGISSKSSGRGIGLRLARNIVAEHNASIEAFSNDRKGYGAFFEIVLPYAPIAGPQPITGDRSTIQNVCPRLNKIIPDAHVRVRIRAETPLRISIIDEDAAILKSIRAMLMDADEVREYTDFQSFKRDFRPEETDLVISDCALSSGTVEDCAHLVLNSERAIPFCLISVNPQERFFGRRTLLDLLKSVRGWAFLSGPFTGDVLCEAIDSYRWLVWRRRAPHRRILLLDDEPIIYKYVSIALHGLERRGFEIDYCTCITEALLMVEQHAYAFILADKNLSDSTTVPFLKALPERGISVPVYLLTGEDPLGPEIMKLQSAGLIMDCIYKGHRFNDSLRYLARLIIGETEDAAEDRNI